MHASGVRDFMKAAARWRGSHLSDHFAVENIEGSEQGRYAVPFVAVGLPSVLRQKGSTFDHLH